MQLSYAVHIAKQKGTVHLSDVVNPTSPMNDLKNRDNRSVFKSRLTYGETFKMIWNDPTHRHYPANFFPELKFCSRDKKGDHVFAYYKPTDRRDRPRASQKTYLFTKTDTA